MSFKVGDTVTLVEPHNYARHRGEVVGLSERHIHVEVLDRVTNRPLGVTTCKTYQLTLHKRGPDMFDEFLGVT